MTNKFRHQAEERVKAKKSMSKSALSKDVVQRNLYELEVHQIELEMQNEELQRTQFELEELRARYFDLYELAPVGYVTLSENGVILEANLSITNLLCETKSALIKQPITKFFLKEDQDIYYLHRQQLIETGEPQACELRMLKDGKVPVWVSIHESSARDAGGSVVHRVVINDITDRKQLESELVALATTDPLTGAINYRHFLKRAKEEFNRALRYREPVTLVLLDVDDFKEINDTYGHDAGDMTLKSITETCISLLRATDIFARLGGDEFAALLVHTDVVSGVKTVERLQSRLNSLKIITGNANINFTVSAGITAIKQDDCYFEEVIKRADLALYAAKKAGRNRAITD